MQATAYLLLLHGIVLQLKAQEKVYANKMEITGLLKLWSIFFMRWAVITARWDQPMYGH